MTWVGQILKGEGWGDLDQPIPTDHDRQANHQSLSTMHTISYDNPLLAKRWWGNWTIRSSGPFHFRLRCGWRPHCGCNHQQIFVLCGLNKIVPALTRIIGFILVSWRGKHRGLSFFLKKPHCNDGGCLILSYIWFSRDSFIPDSDGC